MFGSVLERQRVILKDKCHHKHSCLAKGTVDHLLFGLVGSVHFYASGNVCNLAPF